MSKMLASRDRDTESKKISQQNSNEKPQKASQ